MSDSRIKEIIRLRGGAKAKLTNFSNYVKILLNSKTLDDSQITELEICLAKLPTIESEFNKFQSEFEVLSDETEEEDIYAERQLFESKYYEVVAQATQLIKTTRKRRDESQLYEDAASTSSDSHQDFVRLPKINLPLFDGDIQHWLEFRDTYISLIHSNKNMSDINKFHYLRASLKGSAALILQSIDFRKENYEIAWDLLQNRFNNERLLISNHINAILNLEESRKNQVLF